MQNQSNAAQERFPHTSEMLHALLEPNTADRITVSDFIGGLKNRVLGIIMLTFSIPCIIPMPPGVAAACGLVLLSCGIHLILGLETLWLPKLIASRSLSSAILERIVRRTLPVVQHLERLCRPRWSAVTSRSGRSFIGIMVVIQSIVLILPIPVLGNLPPGVAVGVIALGLVERDGFVILIGLILSILAIGIASAVAWAALFGFSSLF